MCMASIKVISHNLNLIKLKSMEQVARDLLKGSMYAQYQTLLFQIKTFKLYLTSISHFIYSIFQLCQLGTERITLSHVKVLVRTHQTQKYFSKNIPFHLSNHKC